MTSQPTEAVIAGSKGFALALLAPLTERVGTRPRVAGDASQALKLTGRSGLVVIEFQDDRSLDAIRQLLDQANGLHVVAAVPEGHAAAEEALRSLGVEPARWDGKPDGVLAAVARSLAAAAPRAPPAAPAQPAAPAASAPVRAGVGALFDDVALDDVGARTPARREGPPPPAAPPAPAGPWPASVPSEGEASAALEQALHGVLPPPGSPLAVVREVMAGMTPVERAVLARQPQPVDAAPIRSAAVMRVRVAVALATAPRDGGAAVDAAGVSALLAEMDGLLSEVNALVAGAAPELQPSLEQVRNALVKEAIDFSEAAHRGEPGAGAPAAPPPGITTAAERKASQTRILSLAKGHQQVEEAQAAQRRNLWIVLAVSLVLAGGYHGYRWFVVRSAIRAAASERPTRAGAPADALVPAGDVPGAPIVIRTRSGRPFTPEELKRMEAEEALRGNTLRTVGKGGVVVLPRPPGGAQDAPAPRAER